MDIKIERAILSDVPEISLMMKEGLAGMGAGFKDDTTRTRYVLSAVLSGDPIILVAFIMRHGKRRLVGMLAGDLRTQPFRSDLLIAYGHFTYVKPEYRARGLGMLFAQAAEREAAALGAKELLVETDKPEAFEAHGYKRAFVVVRKEIT